MSPSQIQKLFANCQAVFLDLDGTLYIEDTVIPLAPEFVAHLKTMGKKVFFLSNNSSKSTQQYLPKLYDLGFDIAPSELYNSLNATLDYLQEEGLQKLYVVGSEHICQEFVKKGFSLQEEKPQAVVLTYDQSFTYQKFCTAFHAIQEGARYIATHPDLLCPAQKRFIPDIGCFISAFKSAGCGEPLIIGKPEPTMITPLLKKYNLQAEDCIFIGDRLYTDIALAKRMGFPGILVLSGETKSEDLSAKQKKELYITENVGTLLKALQP